MQQHSVKRKKINWTALRQQTFAFTFGAETPADTYPAINYALIALGDHHSSFFEPQDVEQRKTAALTSDEDPHGQAHLAGSTIVGAESHYHLKHPMPSSWGPDSEDQWPPATHPPGLPRVQGRQGRWMGIETGNGPSVVGARPISYP